MWLLSSLVSEKGHGFKSLTFQNYVHSPSNFLQVESLLVVISTGCHCLTSGLFLRPDISTMTAPFILIPMWCYNVFSICTRLTEVTIQPLKHKHQTAVDCLVLYLSITLLLRSTDRVHFVRRTYKFFPAFTHCLSFSCCSLMILLVSSATFFWCISSCLSSSRRASTARRSSSVMNSSLP